MSKQTTIDTIYDSRKIIEPSLSVSPDLDRSIGVLVQTYPHAQFGGKLAAEIHTEIPQLNTVMSGKWVLESESLEPTIRATLRCIDQCNRMIGELKSHVERLSAELNKLKE